MAAARFSFVRRDVSESVRVVPAAPSDIDSGQSADRRHRADRPTSASFLPAAAAVRKSKLFDKLLASVTTHPSITPPPPIGGRTVIRTGRARGARSASNVPV